MPIPRVTISKYGGDDRYSWAVFVAGERRPVVTGLGQDEARYHKNIVEKQLRERAERRTS